MTIAHHMLRVTRRQFVSSHTPARTAVTMGGSPRRRRPWSEPEPRHCPILHNGLQRQRQQHSVIRPLTLILKSRRGYHPSPRTNNATTQIHVMDGQTTDDKAEQTFAALVQAAIAPNPDISHVGMDCEGVHLGRLGTLEILSVCFEPTNVFLLDLSSLSAAAAGAMMTVGMTTTTPGTQKSRHFQLAQQLLESPNVTKVIHDCRMDSDALYHLYGIRLDNIHDTLCYHQACFQSRANLHLTLQNFGMVPTTRQRTPKSALLQKNPEHWETRPLTATMKQQAAHDVVQLVELALRQEQHIQTQNPRQWQSAKAASQRNAQTILEKKVQIISCQTHHFGGTKLRQLEAASGCFLYERRGGDKGGSTWAVYYKSEAGLNLVKREMGH